MTTTTTNIAMAVHHPCARQMEDKGEEDDDGDGARSVVITSAKSVQVSTAKRRTELKRYVLWFVATEFGERGTKSFSGHVRFTVDDVVHFGAVALRTKGPRQARHGCSERLRRVGVAVQDGTCLSPVTWAMAYRDGGGSGPGSSGYGVLV